MGDFERRSQEAERQRAREAQAKVDAYRAELTNQRGSRCETCRYWDSSISLNCAPDRSPCRINPPVVQINRETAAWPFVSHEDWCGMHVLDPIKVDDLCMEFARENAGGR